MVIFINIHKEDLRMNTTAIKAADWWTEKIQERNTIVTKNQLDNFKKNLSYVIDKHLSYNASMTISTYIKTSPLIKNIAFYAGMPFCIIYPKGYEMKIIINNVYIYNNKGELIQQF